MPSAIDARLREYRRQGLGLLVGSAVLLVLMLIGGVVLLAYDPTDTTVATFVGGLLLLPLAAMGVRLLAMVRSRAACVLVTEEQFPELHGTVREAADRLGLTDLPPIYITLTPSAVNPCAKDAGARPSIQLGTDFIAGCRENGTPEALRFMVAHQVGHIAQRHHTWPWALVSQFSQNIPVLAAYFARNLEFTADLYGHRLAPEGTVRALALCAVGKDNFPYVVPEVELRKIRGMSYFRKNLVPLAADEVSPAERLDRLALLDATATMGSDSRGVGPRHPAPARPRRR